MVRAELGAGDGLERRLHVGPADSELPAAPETNRGQLPDRTLRRTVSLEQRND